MPSVEPKKPPQTHSQARHPPGPRPFSLVTLPAFSLQLSSREHSCLSAVAGVRLPRLIAQVGHRRALHGSKWTQGPQLVASALGTELPVIQRSVPEPEQVEQPGENQTRRGPVRFRKARVPRGPVNVEEVLYLLSTSGAHHRGPQIFYLQEEPGPVHRPYDLHVVAPSKARSEHYVFCRSGVFHMTPSGYGGMTSLAQWYREAVYWHALHKMPFFRLFKLRKAFCWWRLHVRHCLFRRRCEQLQSLLLTDSALYRAALFGLARTQQEVWSSPWLPQSGSYKLMELCDALQNQRKHFQCNLGLFSQYCRNVLQRVQEESHRLLHQLQCHFRLSQEAKHFCGPLHLHQRHQHELQRELRTAEHALNRWDSFARLVNYMTVGTMVTSIQQDVAHFSYNVLQTQSLSFQTELTLSAQRQLSVDPGLHQFHALLRDLLTAKDFLIQMCDICDFSGETSLQDLVYSCATDVGFSKHTAT
ncbi:dynein heavy chain domain-containing protein 1 [Boleophthalmus pectinirostris]|uniref:dynein heavy chain domain-containing protein 1 n=1 Tax=Boleophthalmus pectinirostris TaxID=150288 RepID=UPI002432D0FF|nr:dynein heavy chain domain-containing protein 1 [Boleophthalmus pectinirostris]